MNRGEADLVDDGCLCQGERQESWMSARSSGRVSGEAGWKESGSEVVIQRAGRQNLVATHRKNQTTGGGQALNEHQKA